MLAGFIDNWHRLVWAWKVYKAVQRVHHLHIVHDMGVSRWFRSKYGDIYLRCTWHTIDRRESGLAECLDIASIEIHERYQRKGFFKIALAVFENAARTYNYEAVFIENVLNGDLHDYLKSRGYEELQFLPLTFVKRNARHVDPESL